MNSYNEIKPIFVISVFEMNIKTFFKYEKYKTGSKIAEKNEKPIFMKFKNFEKVFFDFFP